MADIILTTLNARYIHSAFGLRYLYANLGDLQQCTTILEFEINHRPHDIVENILKEDPKIVGIGVYIWNARQVQDLLLILRRVAPKITVILGGPEVSFETEDQDLYRLCDYVVTGEADLSFGELCRDLRSGIPPKTKILNSPLPQVDSLQSPYDYYNEKDIAHRVLYVEASRGCPFTCEFCLSSIDLPVRQFALDPFLAKMQKLLDRGARQFKFIDRTFNLNIKIGKTILEFFLERYKPGMFFHFEMVPDRLPEALRTVIAGFPPGSLQFEVGIQSFNPEVGVLISRKQNFEKITENIRFLRQHTGVHIHADLIAGLPGETLESFASGFDTLVALDPQEIQVGILKRLRGTPIIRHDDVWQMVYSPQPPYELLSNKLVNFQVMQSLGRFSKYWDLVANSGNFTATKPLLWKNSKGPFSGFMAWSEWLHGKTGARHGFSLKGIAEYLFEYLSTEGAISIEESITSLRKDFERLNRSDLPKCLRYSKDYKELVKKPEALPERQARHLN